MAQLPNQQPQADPAPNPQPLPPWAFGPTYSQPLPPHLRFATQQFLQLSQWADGLQPLPPPPPAAGATATSAAIQVTPATKIATYASAAEKNSEVAAAGTAQQRADAAAGHTLSVARPSWPASRPVAGVVTSPLSSAVDHQQGRNEWHTVAMAREGNKVWVHDPSYQAADYAGSARPRVASVPGNKMVGQLVSQWPNVSGVWYQGPPNSFAQGQQQCMGRSALWVENTLQGAAPWPPDTRGSGGNWSFHYKN